LRGFETQTNRESSVFIAAARLKQFFRTAQHLLPIHFTRCRQTKLSEQGLPEDQSNFELNLLQKKPYKIWLTS
jgi:hypothetical protein